MESRGVIDRAEGILTDRHELTADQAFHVLAQVSMRTNGKLDTIADDPVHTGDLPPGTWFAPPH